LNIKKIIESGKLSKSELARRLGVTPGMVRHIVSGDKPIPLRHAIKIAEIYGIPAEDLHSDVALVKQHLDEREI
jgi:transcriptional regulator with XRE-family HTH domain